MRLPLRARLALAFALAMAVVIAAIGLFVELRVQRSLNSAIDQGLRARAADVVSLAAQVDHGLRSAGPFAAGGFGELMTFGGRVFDATPGLPSAPLLDPAQLARVRGHSLFAVLEHVRGIGAARILAESIRAQDQRAVLVVGASLASSRSALESLRAGLFIGGPLALLLATLGGYLLAGAALRPVERMRAQAAGLSADGPGARLPIPAGEDEIARLGRTLNAMLERLQQARVREQRFLADASHELRTPLTLLKTELELALDQPRSAPELVSALRSSAEEVDRLAALAEDLLLLAQLDQGRLPVRATPLDVEELAARVASRFAPRAQRDGRTIAVRVPARFAVLVDPLRIEQALGNLLDNALRHGRGEIAVCVKRAGRDVEIAVRDEGDGFPAGFRSQAFARFTRADAARGGGGAGLGLAIVAAVAQAHGGEAVLGEGAEVIVRLPNSALDLPTGRSLQDRTARC